MCVRTIGSLVFWSISRGGSRQEHRKCSPACQFNGAYTNEEDSPNAELYGFPNLARTNLSSLLKEKRNTASIRSSSSWESPILLVSLGHPHRQIDVDVMRAPIPPCRFDLFLLSSSCPRRASTTRYQSLSQASRLYNPFEETYLKKEGQLTQRRYPPDRHIASTPNWVSVPEEKQAMRVG